MNCLYRSVTVIRISDIEINKDDEIDHRIDLTYAVRSLSEQEMEAARNVVRPSKHAVIKILPNHRLNSKGELEGFLFECSDHDPASILPLNTRIFQTTAVYDVSVGSKGTVFNPDVLRIVMDDKKAEEILGSIVEDIDNDVRPHASFNVISCEDVLSEDDEPDSSCMNVQLPSFRDQRAWREDTPEKFGLYHAFMRNNTSDEREHKLFIVVSGGLRHASEELFNMWEDSGAVISCREFMQCEEVKWLRRAVQRSLDRIAARVARAFNLLTRNMSDQEDVECSPMIPSTTSSTSHDIVICSGFVRVVNNACFTDRADNGCILDMFSSEGSWIFRGPRDTSDFNTFGALWNFNVSCVAFPTTTVEYHAGYPAKMRNNIVQAQTKEYLFPDEQFFCALEKLGFNRNDGVTQLMPVVYRCPLLKENRPSLVVS